MGTSRLLAAVLIAVAVAMTTFSSAQTITPPLSLRQAEYYEQHPQEWQQLLDGLSQAAQQFTPARPWAPGEAPQPGSWTSLNNSPGSRLQNPLLMTDGTVIAMRQCTGKWYKLTPDINGSYINGTWTQIATMPSGYGPLFGGSGVLPDGRVIFEGGEYNDTTQSGTCGSANWTTVGAIYDPVADAWTTVNPPNGWTRIGDAAGIVLDNGTYMQRSAPAPGRRWRRCRRSVQRRTITITALPMRRPRCCRMAMYCLPQARIIRLLWRPPTSLN
jgi:hypothetical protein